MNEESTKSIDEQAYIRELLMDAATDLEVSRLSSFILTHPDISEAIWEAIFNVIHEHTSRGHFDSVTDKESAKSAIEGFIGEIQDWE